MTAIRTVGQYSRDPTRSLTKGREVCRSVIILDITYVEIWYSSNYTKMSKKTVYFLLKEKVYKKSIFRYDITI